MIVLRNGVEIGGAQADVPGGQSGPYLALLTGGRDDALHRTVLPMPGHSDMNDPVDVISLQRLRLPAPFPAALRPLLVPDIHVFVTPEAVTGDATARALTVVAASR
jgi:hypothetical protein